MQIRIKAYDSNNQPLKFAYPGRPDTSLLTTKAIAVEKFCPELKGGFALVGQWVKPIVSIDQLIVSIESSLSPLVVYVEINSSRLVLVINKNPGLIGNCPIPPDPNIFKYRFDIDQMDCQVLTFFAGYSINDAEVSRWSNLVSLSKSDLKSRCANPLYRAGFWLMENNHVPKHILPPGTTPEEYVAQKIGDKNTLIQIAEKKAGNIPIDSVNSQPPQVFANINNLPQLMGWGLEWISEIGGIFFVSDPNKSNQRNFSIMFADVLAKHIAKNKMKNPEQWQKFFEEQAAQLEGIAMTYRVIADIARTNSKFDKLKQD